MGGIHPLQDDISGRIIRKKIGVNAAKYAEHYFLGLITGVEKSNIAESFVNVYPNPTITGGKINISLNSKLIGSKVQLLNIHGSQINEWMAMDENMEISTHDLKSGFYLIRVLAGKESYSAKVIVRQ